MFLKLRSLIFKIDPEIAHSLAIKSLKFNFTSTIFDENKNNPMFQTTLFGKQIDNPIGMAAGFDKNAEVYNPLFKLGFGFVEVGTVTPLKQYGNSKPRVFRLEEDQALINRLGFNSFGAEDINSRIRSNTPTGLLGINIGPNKNTKDRLNDYLIGLRTFHDISDYITINISSPNTPIVVKISPDISKEQATQISQILLKHEIEGIIVSNTTEGNREKLQSTSKHQKGGLSGKPLETISNQLINIFYNLLKGKIEIIGLGGVDSGKSAYEKFLAGANFIQLYTGMVYQGPNIVSKIKKELKEIFINENVSNFKHIVGKKSN